MVFIGTLITSFIVAGVLDLLAWRKPKKTSSLKKFVVRAPIDFSVMGVMGMLLLIGALIFCKIDGTYIPPVIMVLLFIGLFIPSMLLMLAPIKGLWDVIVDGDDITVVKAFIFKRHWKFSSITHGKATRGGIKIYVEGRKRKALFVDAMCDGTNQFMKRMEKEGKEIIFPENIFPEKKDN